MGLLARGLSEPSSADIYVADELFHKVFKAQQFYRELDQGNVGGGDANTLSDGHVCLG